MENDKFYIPERILNMSQKEIRSEIESMDKYRKELKQFRELCEEIKRVMPITDAEIELLDKAVMFWNVYEQIVWERNIAISQLEELGLSLGENVDHVKELIEDKPQWVSCSEKLPEERESVFKKFKGTDKWDNAMFEGISDDVNVTVEFEDGTRSSKVSHTLDGKWKCEKDYGVKMKVIAWCPLPAPYKGE